MCPSVILLLHPNSLVAQTVKNSPAMQETWIWAGKIPWRREWLPTPVFLPGEFHGWRSLEGYSPWSHKEWDMTEQLTLSLLCPQRKTITILFSVTMSAFFYVLLALQKCLSTHDKGYETIWLNIKHQHIQTPVWLLIYWPVGENS